MSSRRNSANFPIDEKFSVSRPKSGSSSKYDNEEALRRVLETKSKPSTCDSCGSANLKYLGVGKYECSDCKKIVFDAYGKVRKCIEEKAPGELLNAREIIKRTGITKEELNQMIAAGSFALTPSGVKLGE